MKKVREIEYLTDSEHLLLRPSMYIGNVSLVDEKIILWDSPTKKFKWKTVEFSEGFYRLFTEIVDNSYDEISCSIREGFFPKDGIHKIKISIDSKTNLVSIEDSGRGFYNPDGINSKTNVSNLETAVSFLRAGSNFRNGEEDSVSVIGMNGIGSSAVNVFSDFFSISTRNSKMESPLTFSWEKFTPTQKIGNQKEGVGTLVEFQPRKSIFGGIHFDFDIIYSKLILKQFQMRNTIGMESTIIEFYWNGELVELESDILVDSVSVDLNKKMKLYIWESHDENDAELSFVNSSQCVGFHQVYTKEFLNDTLFEGLGSADKFYRTLLILNLPPKYVQFNEQIKTRFSISRNKLNQILPLKLTKKDKDLISNTQTFQSIITRIEEFENLGAVKKLKSKKSQLNDIDGIRFFGAKKQKRLFLVEGNSALGSILQCRNPETDSFYALRGKIKNTTNIKDLSESKVIVDLISILGLNINDRGKSCKYDEIVIASDYDEDGHAIAGLILAFFQRWFPLLISNGKVFRLTVPLGSFTENKTTKYIYTLQEIEAKEKEGFHLTYLKGLGSLNKEDWVSVFKKLPLMRFVMDSKTENMIKMAFDEDKIPYRKKWLMR